MKVFISWSGPLSRKLAEAIRSWIPAVLQAARPYFTPDDVEKGTRWGQEVSKELELSSVGVFCLTSDNLEAPWIMFEAGALAKHLDKSRVCPILFGGVDNTDLKGPLVQFQAVKFEKPDIKKLIDCINAQCGESKLESQVLASVFDMWWPKLETEVSSVLAQHKASPNEKKRSDRELIEEVLELSRASMMHARHRTDRIEPELLEHAAHAIQRLMKLAESDKQAILIREAMEPLMYLLDRHGRNFQHRKVFRDLDQRLRHIAPTIEPKGEENI